MKATTLATAGSVRTSSTYSRILSRMAGNEMSWSAWMLPISRPVSCWGKKPLATAENSRTLATIVASVTSRVTNRWRSTHRSVTE